MRILAAFCLLAAAVAAQGQQIYRWVDAGGKVHYGTEKPPADARAAGSVASRISAVGGNGAPADARAAREAALAARPKVKMYATGWCPYCAKARRFFAAHNVPFTEVDVERNEAGKAEYRALGGKSVPIILVGDERLNGYNEPHLAKVLKAAGY